MAPSYRDRRRFLLATVLTLVALPALWWANRSEESAAPNVAVAGAAVGVDVGAAHASDRAADIVEPPTSDATVTSGAPSDATRTLADDTAAAATTPAPPSPSTSAPSTATVTEDDVPGAQAPVYLGGPPSNVGAGLSQIAVPAKPAIERVRTTATFRSNIGGSSACGIPGVVNARTVTVVNLNNGRSVECTTVAQRGSLGDQVVLDTELFARLADLTDAPIHVEIRR